MNWIFQVLQCKHATPRFPYYCLVFCELEVPPAKRLAAVSDADIAAACNATVPEVTKMVTCFGLKVLVLLQEKWWCCY